VWTLDREDWRSETEERSGLSGGKMKKEKRPVGATCFKLLISFTAAEKF
jgi:hypothetical protein